MKHYVVEMNGTGWDVLKGKFQRIDRRVARRLFESGQVVYAAPCKMRPCLVFEPGNPWGQDFAGYEEAATYYQCRSFTGSYLAYYRKLED